MAITVDFSSRDINKGKIITPSWYRVRIDGVAEAPSKDGQSTNWNMEGTILYDADTKDTEFAEMPTPYWNFNSKAKGFMIGLFESLGVAVEAGSRYDLNSMIGKTVDVFVENDMYEGRLVNRINHKYRKPKD